MKTIKLFSLIAKNFKGLHDIQVDFGGEDGTVKGPNASGKTTLMDAFNWLLFGKDSQGRSDFQIRPLDENGKMIDNIDIEVTALLDIDGSAVELSKKQSQKWTKHRGSSAPSFEGNVNAFTVDGFPVSQKEYAEKISDIIPEDLFKLLTNPRAFASLKWQEQRSVLMRMVADVSDESILNTDPEGFAPIRADVLAAGADKAREKAAMALRKLKEEQKSYPIRIDEASRSIVEVDVPALTERKQNLEQQLSAIEAEKAGLIDNTSTIRSIQAEMMQVKLDAESLKQKRTAELKKAKMAVYGELNIENDEIDALNKKLTQAQRDYKTLMNAIDSDTDALADETARYKEIKASEIPENELVCPTCGRPFEDATAEERKDAFNKRKAEQLDRIIANGKSVKERLDQNKALVEGMEKGIDALTDALAEANREREAISERYNHMPTEPDMTQDAEYLALNDKLQELEKHLSSVETANEATDTFAERTRMVSDELERVNAELSMVDANKRAEERIRALQEQQRDNGQMVADAEQVLFLVEEFVKLKMETISGHVNAKFKKVRFKLFDTLINGGMKETCTMQVNSNGSYVDYSNANHAAQIMGGLDVIDALTELNGVSAPVFVDNAEALDNSNQPKSNSQLILLKVSDDKTLTIVKEG